MKQDAADFIRRCHTRQVHASLIHSHPNLLQDMTTPWPFQTWGLDLINPIHLSSEGYIWILVATKCFTKWVEAIPLRKATGPAVLNFIKEHIICHFGIPYKIVSGNGTPFVNQHVRKLLDTYKIKHWKSTPYYPKGNGQVEATNKSLLRILSKMVYEYEGGWSIHLQDTLWAHRTSSKTATSLSPYFLVYGCDTILPDKVLVPTARILAAFELDNDVDICGQRN
ncbi:hypothetical protein SLEP1_g22282 [Rubroshorea leprosula]|nr:hypothetical protein SLEP1_g22282 [Rubroshorea leprosula]